MIIDEATLYNPLEEVVNNFDNKTIAQQTKRDVEKGHPYSQH